MTYISLKGTRESKTVNSEEYKKKVVEYFQSKGYVKIHDSAIDGILPDLIFKMPLVEGDKETWVEIKYSELSLKNKQFLNEFGRVFNGYMLREGSKRFSYYIVAKKFLNQQVWRNIFEETKCYQQNVKELHDLISDTLKGDDLIHFQKHSYDDFMFFITDCSIIDGDYEDFLREIEANKERKHYVLNQELLKDESKVLHKKEMLMSNCIKVTSVPKIIWIADCKGKIDLKDFFRRNREAVVYFHSNKIYSIKPITQKSGMIDYVKPETVEKILFDNWNIEEKTKINIIKYLIRSYIISKGSKIGQKYCHEHKCLFFKNKNPSKYPEYKFHGYQVSKYYKKSDFVKHDALRIDIREINGEFYVVFNLIFIFTHDGYEVITGKSATALHRKFRKNYIKNERERNLLTRWINWFNFNVMEFFSTESDYFHFSRSINIESHISYEGGESFDTTLLDFMDEDGENNQNVDFNHNKKKMKMEEICLSPLTT